MDREARKSLIIRLEEETQRLQALASKVIDAPTKPAVVRANVRHDLEIPRPPDLKLHVLRDYDLGEIFDYINPKSLYAKHLGFKNFEEELAKGDAKARELADVVEEVAHLMIARTDITANAIYKFFPAQSDGDRTMMVLSPDGKNVLETFIFGRQSDAPGLCLADYIAPRDSGRRDYVSFFITTIGTGIRALAEDWKNKGDYLRSHILQVLGLEGAEAFAELLHEKIRAMWGIGDPAGTTRKDLFQAHYHGNRFSPGYPACPRMEDQEQIFRLLEVDKQSVDVRLTEGYMMDPEASVSAIVIHHPDAKYFSLSPADIERLERELAPAPKEAATG
jgi:5-methyltetrahydrofolate--homocysteine methyltransferase